MVEADFADGGQRGIGGDVAADVGVVFVGAHHHGRRVPANQALDAAFQRPVARIGHFFVSGNRVHVRSIELAEASQRRNSAARFEQLVQQIGGPVGPSFVDYLIQSFQPFGGFLWVQVRLAFFFGFEHFDFSVASELTLYDTLPVSRHTNSRVADKATGRRSR